jgi:hypothetical protein
VSRLRVTLVPHTHWDREWYEPFAVFSERLVAMMDTLLELAADGFPHFHLDGQTAMIDDYLERRPERTDELAERVREGRLSAGPWVTQMDEFLTSGESHIRNLEMGLERARELGRALEVGYMPDQFGHIGQMPQILRMAGIERAMVWRGVPSQIARSTFRWRAPDGSEVLTESLPFGYSSGWNLMQAGDAASLARLIEDETERLRPLAHDDHIVVMVGYDHAGPDATLPNRLAEAPLPQGIDVRFGGVGDHVASLSAPDRLPVWQGELRSSARAHLLPNVYSARVHQKLERGRLESLVERYAEPLAALVPGFEWPAAELRRVWTLLLWNGAHDSACGCSHDQVATDVDGRFAEIRSIAESIVERAASSLGRQIGQEGALRFNPSPFERDGVPGLGYAVSDRAWESPNATVALEPLPDGAGVVADGIPLRLFDEPDVGDLYNWCYADEGQRPSPPSSVRIEGDSFEVTWDGLRVSARATRREDEPFVRLTGLVDNGRGDHRLRLHVGLPQRAERAIAGAPFELVDRPLVGEGSAGETASPTWPARHAVMAAGTAVFHEGVFEYEIADGTSIAVTMLRCVGCISRERMPVRPWAAGPTTKTPDAQMLGVTRFSLGVWPGASGERLLRNWERFALPLARATASGGGTLPSAGSLLAVDGDAELSGVRRVGGRTEVRMWNPQPDRVGSAVVAGERVEVRPARIEVVRPRSQGGPAPR